MFEFKTRPFAHQKIALRRAGRRREYAFLMEMGTGKTKVVIDEAGILYDEGQVDTMLVLAPKGVYRNWYGELYAHSAMPYVAAHWEPGGGNNDLKHRLRRVVEPDPDRMRVLLMNIEALSSGTVASRYLRKFLSSGRCYAALDESTKIKNRSANRTQRVLSAGQLAQFRRIMSGSPVTKSPLDLWSQFEFLRPGMLGFSSYYAFRARYAVMKKKEVEHRDPRTGERKTRKVDIVVAHRNLPDLTERLEGVSYRVKKEDCLDLPPKLYTMREVELTEEQERVYRELSEEALSEVGGSFASVSSAITMILRLHQVVCGHVRTEDGAIRSLSSRRLDALMETVEEASGDIIIWTNYRENVREICESLRREYGAESTAEFHGGNTRTRDEDAQRFISSDQCRFMVSTQQSGGHGNTWVNANTVIYFSNNYDLELRQQSEDRAHRHGQRHAVTYVDLVAPRTVDMRILEALRRKIEISETVLNDSPREWLNLRAA